MRCSQRRWRPGAFWRLGLVRSLGDGGKARANGRGGSIRIEVSKRERLWPTPYLDIHTWRWFKGGAHARGWRCAANEAKIESLKDTRQHNLRFKLSERGPDAVARAAAKWRIRIGRALSGVFTDEAIRLETIRRGPIPLLPMGQVDGVQHARSCRNKVALEREIGRCDA